MNKSILFIAFSFFTIISISFNLFADDDLDDIALECGNNWELGYADAMNQLDPEMYSKPCYLTGYRFFTYSETPNSEEALKASKARIIKLMQKKAKRSFSFKKWLINLFLDPGSWEINPLVYENADNWAE